MRTLAQQSIDAIVEVGPKPVLLGLGQRCLAGIGGIERPRLWLPSLRPGRDACQQMLGNLAQLYKAGASVRWEGLEERDRLFHGVRGFAQAYPPIHSSVRATGLRL